MPSNESSVPPPSQTDLFSSRADCGGCSATTANVLISLRRVESRIMSAWTRLGIAEGERQRKWSTFVDDRLVPFLHDYVRLQEAEEMAFAAANDRLFSELFFLSRRLREPPRAKELARLVDAVAADGAAPAESDAAVLPSFVAVTSAMATAGERSENERGGEVSAAAAPLCIRARQELEEREGKSPHRSSLEGIAHREASPHAMAVVWRVAQSMTHQELRRNLDVEVARMSTLADARLRQLCMLYKQRALLRLPPQEQAALRMKYAERILGRGTSTPVTPTSGASATKRHSRQPLPSSAPISSRQSLATAGLTSGRASHGNISADDVDLLSDTPPKQLQSREGDVQWTDMCVQEVKEGEEKDEEDGEAEEVVEKETDKEGESHRGTVFSVDLSDLTRFGRRQDLSLARISTEAQEIYAEINAQNDSMVTQGAQELKLVEELWDLLKAPIHNTNVNERVEGSTKEEGGTNDEETLEGDDTQQKADALSANENDECKEIDPTVELQDVFAEANKEEEEKEEEEGALSQAAFRQHLAQLQMDYEQNHSSQSHFTSSESHGPASLDESLLARHMDATTLPSPLMRLFTARSYAPVFAYITNVREDLQRRLLHRHVRIARSLTQRLTALYREYYEKTLDDAYSIAPDYSLWLRENAAAAATAPFPSSAAPVPRVLSPETETEEKTRKRGEELWTRVLSEYIPRRNDESLRARLSEVRQVISRAHDEVRSLRARLCILAAVEPLLRRRAEIVSQQRAIHDGSRERLLSKKVNMARQLLFEENARRQFARELPRLHEQIESLLREWNGAVGADAARRLIVRGTDVAAALAEFRAEAQAKTGAKITGKGKIKAAERRAETFATPQPRRAEKRTRTAHSQSATPQRPWRRGMEHK